MDLALIALLAGLGALTQSGLGFGYAILFTPLATLIVGAQSAVATSLVTGTVMSFGLYAESRPRAPLRSVLPLAVIGTLTTPIGIWLLTRADEVTLRLLVGTAVLGTTAVNMLSRPRLEARSEHPAAVVGAGALSGVLRGSTSLGGPPIVLYQHWLGGGPTVIRGRLFAYFALSSLPGLAIATAGGVITRQVLVQSALALPVIAVAVALGPRVRARLSEVWFRRLSIGLLLFTAVVAIYGALDAASG
jgi:uncharacterized membrane protein YfcA